MNRIPVQHYQPNFRPEYYYSTQPVQPPVLQYPRGPQGPHRMGYHHYPGPMDHRHHLMREPTLTEKRSYVTIPCPTFFKTKYDLKNDIILDVTHEMKYTKPCNNVYMQKDGTFSSCHKKDCTFAHSITEYKVKTCTHDMKCYKFNNPKSRFMCPFLHSCENGYDWVRRTGMRLPVLPMYTKKVNSESVEQPPEEIQIEKINYDDFKEFLSCSHYYTDEKNNSIHVITPSKYAEKALVFSLQKGMTNISIKIMENVPPCIIDLSDSEPETEDEEDY